MEYWIKFLMSALIINFFVFETANAGCRSDIASNAPDSRFTIHNDGTVTDNQTGLMWLRCSLGQNWNGSTCNGSSRNYDWEEALDAAENASDASYSDWYLPNIKELESIVELACVSPSINEVIFPNSPSNRYWSSSPSITNSQYARELDFDNGNAGSYIKTGVNRIYHVRLVRLSN